MPQTDVSLTICWANKKTVLALTGWHGLNNFRRTFTDMYKINV